MTDILDIHTHHADADHAVIAIDPRQFSPQAGKCYAVGFHPWGDLSGLTADDWALLERCARHPQVLAVGETGMDRLRGDDLAVQADAFVRHLQIALAVGKPVIVHMVRTSQDILYHRRRARLTAVPLVIHGMRSAPQVARTLVVAGCYLSFGPNYNPLTVAATPRDRLLVETDDADIAIDNVLASVAQTLDITTEELKAIVADNARQLFSRCPAPADLSIKNGK